MASLANENSILIYFADAMGKFPEFEPNYPVIWLMKGKEDVRAFINVLLKNIKINLKDTILLISKKRGLNSFIVRFDER